MKIAFVSCICITHFPQQPVWDWIAASQPDYLVLLGDSIYLDIDAGTRIPPMTDDQFAQHLHGYWSAQLAQPRFRALLKQLGPGRVKAIWDDHDFLWNNAAGAAIRAQPTQLSKLSITTAFLNAFRAALDAPDQFPTAYGDAAFWNSSLVAPEISSLELEPGLCLHLSDSRSWRTETQFIAQANRHLLGKAQRAKLQKAMAAQPDAVHLLACGSTSKDWKDYQNDWSWLKEQAAQRRTLLLAGDVHHNDVDAFFTTGFPLHEVVSSGAAVKQAVVVGPKQENHGILTVTADAIDVALFSKNVPQPLLHRTLSRSTWLPV